MNTLALNMIANESTTDSSLAQYPIDISSWGYKLDLIRGEFYTRYGIRLSAIQTQQFLQRVGLKDRLPEYTHQEERADLTHKLARVFADSLAISPTGSDNPLPCLDYDVLWKAAENAGYEAGWD